LISGSTANVIGLVENKPWYQVKVSGGRIGYVYAPLLEKPAPTTEKETPPRKIVATPSRELSTSGGFKDCTECPEMVSLPAGSFTMGDNKGDRSEKPAHKVTIKKPFAIGKFEVTVGEWKSCVTDGACKPTSDEVQNVDDAPVRDISWADATDYVKWLSRKTNQEYRLPTEAEWEYAARAGTQTTYWWGNNMQSGKANCKDCGGQTSYEHPSKVGNYEPNPFGIHDMNGNVWEWVDDCWHRNFQGAPRDGSAWTDGNCAVRVIRSGSWRNDKTYVHSASRFKYDAYIRYIQNGFRVAKTLDQ
jgi:formylglycine-generating enzyme required for sulfatase activity